MASSTAVQAQDASFRIAIALDITGSMSCELEGVKNTVAKLVELLQELPVPLALAILTFTEDSKGSYTSCKEFKEQAGFEEARTYVQNITLCCPPEHPEVRSASGDDGPENHKAALYRLTDLEPMPTIAFLITDAEPHMADPRPSATHRKELNWLVGRGLDTAVASDLFRLFALVDEHYSGSLVLNCVVYSGAAHDVYGSLVQRTGGMLMEPVSRQPAVLAKGMLDVIGTLLSSMPGGAHVETAVTSLEGFQLYDVSGLPARECEEDPGGQVVKGDNEALFAIAMERLVTVCGSKWTKRAVGMTAPAEQLEFVWRTARYVARHATAASAEPAPEVHDSTAASAELRALLSLRERIVEQLPAEQRGHFSISPDDITALAASASALSSTPAVLASAPVSAISLESVGDALAEDADWSDWLATVMRLLHGYPMRLQMPLDKNGKPDFMDAWSAVCLALGIDRMSAADFMQLVGDATSATGPTDKREHNALLLLVEPHDALATLVFKVASGTQVINYASGILMGARGFLPNLYAGTAASCLLRLLGSPAPLSSFETRQAAAIVHTLRSFHRTPAAAVAQQLSEGRANPADNVAKLLAAALRLDPKAQLRLALRLILEEWLGAMVSRHYGGRGPEADEAYRTSLAKYITLDVVIGTPPAGASLPTGEGLDPLSQVHALEVQDKGQVLGSFRPDWQARLAARLRDGNATSGLEAHPVWAQFTRCAGAMLSLLLPAEEAAGKSEMGAVAATGEDGAAWPPGGEVPQLAQVWPGWERGVVRALLLRHRTARYRCVVTEGAKEPLWEPLAESDVGTSDELVLERLKESYASELRGYKQARVVDAEARLLTAAAAEVVAHGAQEGEGVAEALAAALKDLYLDLQAGRTTGPTGRPASAPKGPLATLLDGTEHRLDRTYVPRLLEALPSGFSVTGPVMRALVLGEWTTSAPQSLRRAPAVLQRCQELGLDDVLAGLRTAEKCGRTVGCNRLGHTAERQYPGPCGWTVEYSEGRVADRPKRAPYVHQMKRFTDFAAWAKGVAGQSDGAALPEGLSREQVVSKVDVVLMTYEDANRLDDKVKVQVEGLLGRSMEAVKA